MSTDNFPAFASIVHQAFQRLAHTQPFEVDLPDEVITQAYLDAFPAGANPLFKSRTEHDCGCCRHFLRRAGKLVTLDTLGAVHTVWEDAARLAPAPYAHVARVLHDLVSTRPIADVYLVGKNEGAFGQRQTHTADKLTGDVTTNHHFFTSAIPQALRHATPGERRGEVRTTVQVFQRGLEELSLDAVDLVLEMVANKALYRGEEHKPALDQFQAAKRAYIALPHTRARELFAWREAHGPACRFRNTVIGTLVQDLSAGMDTEEAVKAFETKVAPQNYKRPTAVITPSMVNKAMETVKELGLEPALERRFARLEDVSVRDVLWVDNAVRGSMKGGALHTALLQHAEAVAPAAEPDLSRAEPLALSAFMQRVLPEAESIELFLDGDHLGNLVSLTAPVHAEPLQLFRWDNDFAWAYAGGVADSIKERVKKAGGNVTNAALRISLSWFNHDDLDLHVYEPRGAHIHFASKRGLYGMLDVDMNAGWGSSRTPVENVAFVKAPDGRYAVAVHNYQRREAQDVGFVVEVENKGRLTHYAYKNAVPHNALIPVCNLTLKNGAVTGVEIGPGTITGGLPQEKWGLRTLQWSRVNVVTLSPNYWGSNAVGNKHVFFFLDKAKNDEPTRGIFNEFLHPRLEQHRKVFEVIGEKTKCQPTDGQLTGVGFSSTKTQAVIVRVTQGRKQRLFNINTGA